MSKIGLVVLGLIFLLVGAGLYVYGPDQAAAEQERIDNSVEIDAEIIHSDVRTVRSGGSSSQTDSRSRDDTDYQPEIEFSYEFEGETYYSDRMYPSSGPDRENRHRHAREVVDQYPEGQVVTAYVDPNHPDKAFLTREVSTTATEFRIGGAIFAVLGLALLGFGLFKSNGRDD